MSQERIEKAIQALQNTAVLIGKSQSHPVVIADEEVIPGLGLDNDAGLLLDGVDLLRTSQLQIACIGRVNSGKSTLIEALVNRNILQTGIMPTTGVITRIVDGPDSDKVRLVEGGRERVISLEGFNDKYYLTKKEVESIDAGDPFPLPEHMAKVDYATLQIDSLFLRQGISLVDTLGFQAGAKAERITNDFLDRVDVIFLVLNTRALLDAYELELVDEIVDKYAGDSTKMRNIFFVANNFGLDDAEKLDVEETLLRRLKPYFTDASGQFDESLYDRRVFIVDAKAARAVRLTGESSGDVQEKTGFSALNNEVQQLFRENENVSLILAGASRRAASAVQSARDTIETKKASILLTAKDWKAAEADFKKQLYITQEKRDDTKAASVRFLNGIKEKCCNHFERYATDYFFDDPTRARTEEKWLDRWQKVATSVGILDIVHGTFSKNRRAELERELGIAIKKVFDNLLTGWEKAFTRSLIEDEELKTLTAELEVELKDFSVEVNKLQRIIANKPTDAVTDLGENRSKKLLQALISIITLDLNQAIGPLMQSDWRATLTRTVIHVTVPIVAGLIASLFVGGPVAWVIGIGVLIVETAAVLLWDHSVFGEKLINRVGEQLREQIKQALPDIKHALRNEIDETFKERLAKVSQRLTAEIDSVKQVYDTAVTTRRDGQAQIDKEVSRLETIDTLLTKQFEEISEVVGDE